MKQKAKIVVRILIGRLDIHLNNGAYNGIYWRGRWLFGGNGPVLLNTEAGEAMTQKDNANSYRFEIVKILNFSICWSRGTFWSERERIAIRHTIGIVVSALAASIALVLVTFRDALF